MPKEAQHLNTSMMKLSSIFSDSSMLIISLAKFFGCKGVFDTTDCGILGKCCLLENTHLFSYVFTIYLVEKSQRAAWYERRDCCKSKVAEHSNEFLALPVSQLLCACEEDNTSFADCTLLGCRLAQAVKTILELMEERLEQRFSKPFRFNENWPHISQSGTTWLCRSCTLFILHGAKWILDFTATAYEPKSLRFRRYLLNTFWTWFFVRLDFIDVRDAWLQRRVKVSPLLDESARLLTCWYCRRL